MWLHGSQCPSRASFFYSFSIKYAVAVVDLFREAALFFEGEIEVAIGGRDCVIKTNFGEWGGWGGGAFEALDRAERRVEWAETWY